MPRVWEAQAPNSARPAPVLRVALPAGADGGELEVQVQVRRNGVLVAQSGTAIAGLAQTMCRPRWSDMVSQSSPSKLEIRTGGGGLRPVAGDG